MVLDKISDSIEKLAIAIIDHYLVSSLCSIVILALTLCIIVPDKWLLMVVCSLMAGWFVPPMVGYILMAFKGLIWAIQNPISSLKGLATFAIIFFGVFFFFNVIAESCTNRKAIDYLDESEKGLKEIISQIEEDSIQWKDIWESFEHIDMLLSQRPGAFSDEIREELKQLEYKIEEVYSPVEDIEDVIDNLDECHTELTL